MHFFPSRAIALSIGPLSVHWYGVMYALGFVCGLYLLRSLQHYRSLHLTEKHIESLFLHVFMGVLVGGRLGFVLLYGGSEYWLHPLQIIAVWNGGMASHGGFLGVILALVLFCRKHKVDLLALADVIVVPVALGLAFGRVGNLINGELYGTLTTMPWGMHFPGAEGLRHPTQIYAIFKDMLIFFVCLAAIRRVPRLASGYVLSLFLTMYSILRFVVEIFRDQPLGYYFGFSVGQLYTLPILVLGIVIFYCARRRAL